MGLVTSSLFHRIRGKKLHSAIYRFVSGRQAEVKLRQCNEIKCNEIHSFSLQRRAGRAARAVDFVTAGAALVLGDPLAVAGKPGCFGKLRSARVDRM